ncbi:MAG: hypothetical protein WCB12_21855 [Bryobacteraceae bacterium]
MLFMTAVFGGLMLLSIESRRRVIAIMVIGAITVLGTSPAPAQALPFCLPCVIQAVLTTITVTIGGRLTQVNGVLAVILRLFQQTVWPPGKTRLAKSQIQSIIAQFLGVLHLIMSINPHTATLPHPVALENIMRDRSTVDVYSVPPAYVNTYRPVPQAGNIAPQERDLTDMDDAMAQDNLMMLKEADQAQDLQLQLANQIESLAGNPSIDISAPGTSSLITAAAVSGEIRSQAVTQKMLAAMMRQEAARVAHDNAIRKRNAAYAGQLQTDMTNVLQHR